LISKVQYGGTPLHALRDLLSKVHNPPASNAGALARSDFRALSISDAVALSAATAGPWSTARSGRDRCS
jgi:hypothetical protein